MALNTTDDDDNTKDFAIIYKTPKPPPLPLLLPRGVHQDEDGYIATHVAQPGKKDQPWGWLVAPSNPTNSRRLSRDLYPARTNERVPPRRGALLLQGRALVRPPRSSAPSTVTIRQQHETAIYYADALCINHPGPLPEPAPLVELLSLRLDDGVVMSRYRLAPGNSGGAVLRRSSRSKGWCLPCLAPRCSCCLESSPGDCSVPNGSTPDAAASALKR